jgi:hypothetical protein
LQLPVPGRTQEGVAEDRVSGLERGGCFPRQYLFLSIFLLSQLRFIVWAFKSAIFFAYLSLPTSLICRIQAARSDLKMSANIFDMKLLNFLHAMASGNSTHSAHDVMFLPLQHTRILHHDALSLPAHPAQRSLRYVPHAPQ